MGRFDLFSGCAGLMSYEVKKPAASRNLNLPADDRSALWRSLQKKDLKPIEHLLSKGVDCNERNAEGDTPLLYVAREGHYKYPPQGIPLALVKAGANLGAVDNQGFTAVQIALLKGWHRTASMLLQNGANHADVMRIRTKVTHAECVAVLTRFGL